MNGPAVVANQLSKRYGPKWALQQCTVTVPHGRLCALVGPERVREIDPPPVDGRFDQAIGRECGDAGVTAEPEP